MKRLFAVGVVLMMLTFNSVAQVKDFALVDVVTGSTVKLSDFASSNGVAIMFLSNSCPIDDYYTDRIKAFKGDGVSLLLVNAGIDDAESVDNMRTWAVKHGVVTPYLADKDQILLQSLNAHKSTEVFLLKNNGGKFTIYYHGSFDDNPQVPSDVRHPYLKEAIATLVANQPQAVMDNRPLGCAIRRK